MDEYKVIVTSIGGDLGQAIAKALKFSNYPIKVIGTDCKNYEPAFLFCDEFVVIPRADSKQYLDFLNNYIINENISLMYIGNETELFYIANNISELKQEVLNKIVLNHNSVIDICKDKYLTYKFLKNNDFPYPKSLLYDEKTNFNEVLKTLSLPLVLKQNGGCGSKNVHIIKDKIELDYILKFNKTGIVQEYLTGIEYTNGVYIDTISKDINVITFERKLREGMSFESKVVFDEEIENLCKKVATKLNAVGSINIQLRKAYNSPPIIFEINPRYSSTSFIRANFGFNDVIYAFENMVLKKSIYPPKIILGSAYRYITEFYKIKKDD